MNGDQKGRGKKCATAASKRMVTVEAESAKVKESYQYIVDVAAQSEASAMDAQVLLQDSKKRQNKVENEAQLVTDSLDEVQ